MTAYVEELETLLDEDAELDDFEERIRRRRPAVVRTPTRLSSFVPRPATNVASQTQVQSAARNLDAKIETLTNSVKALEGRTNTLSAQQDRQTVALRKEMVERKKAIDAARADLQQTKMLALLLPMLTQQSVDATDVNGKSIRVVTQSQNQLSSILPFLLLLTPSSTAGADGARGPMGDPMMLILFAVMLQDRS